MSVANELGGFQAHLARSTGLFISEAEGDHTVLTSQNAAIGQGHAEQVTSQILQRPRAIAHGLAVHDPVLRQEAGHEDCGYRRQRAAEPAAEADLAPCASVCNPM